MAMSIVQGVGSFPFLSESVYRYLTTGVAVGIAVEDVDVADNTLRFVVISIIYSLSPYTNAVVHAASVSS